MGQQIPTGFSRPIRFGPLSCGLSVALLQPTASGRMVDRFQSTWHASCPERERQLGRPFSDPFSNSFLLTFSGLNENYQTLKGFNWRKSYLEPDGWACATKTTSYISRRWSTSFTKVSSASGAVRTKHMAREIFEARLSLGGTRGNRKANTQDLGVGPKHVFSMEP